MKKEIFDLCLDFHKELIRATLASDTVANAEKFLVDGDTALKGINAQKRKRAKDFAATLKDRLLTLQEWAQSGWFDKCDLYKAEHKRSPSNAAFDAVKLVIEYDLKIGTAAAKCGVNFQCVKVLKPRIERYENYAKKLAEIGV